MTDTTHSARPLVSWALALASALLLAACGQHGDHPPHAAPKAAAHANTPLTPEEQAIQAKLPEKVENDAAHAWMMDAILGKPKQTIKTIGELARKDMEEAFDRRIHLFLHVKVDEDWHEQRSVFQRLGLDYEA